MGWLSHIGDWLEGSEQAQGVRGSHAERVRSDGTCLPEPAAGWQPGKRELRVAAHGHACTRSVASTHAGRWSRSHALRAVAGAGEEEDELAAALKAGKKKSKKSKAFADVDIDALLGEEAEAPAPAAEGERGGLREWGALRSGRVGRVDNPGL